MSWSGARAAPRAAVGRPARMRSSVRFHVPSGCDVCAQICHVKTRGGNRHARPSCAFSGSAAVHAFSGVGVPVACSATPCMQSGPLSVYELMKDYSWGGWAAPKLPRNGPSSIPGVLQLLANSRRGPTRMGQRRAASTPNLTTIGGIISKLAGQREHLSTRLASQPDGHRSGRARRPARHLPTPARRVKGPPRCPMFAIASEHDGGRSRPSHRASTRMALANFMAGTAGPPASPRTPSRDVVERFSRRADSGGSLDEVGRSHQSAAALNAASRLGRSVVDYMARATAQRVQRPCKEGALLVAPRTIRESLEAADKAKCTQFDSVVEDARRKPPCMRVRRPPMS